MTFNTLLAIRAGLNIILFIITLTGAGMLLFSQRNGLTRILGLTAFFASLYVADVVFISFVDVVQYPDIRYYNLATWDVITALLTGSTLLLGIKLLKDKDG